MTITQSGPAADFDPGLTATTSREGPATVVALSGEADVATLAILVDVFAQVMADYGDAVVVDLAAVTFIDTASARALVRAAQLLEARGRRLTIRSPSRIARKVLTILGFTDVVEPALPVAP